MTRVMIDTHVFDYICNEPAVKARLEELVAKDTLRLVTTHAQIDEIEKIGDAAYRERLLSLRDDLHMELVPTKGTLFGISRWGMATFDNSDDLDRLRNSERTENPSIDALIFNTATLESIDFLVSCDKERTEIARKVKPSLVVKKWEEFTRLALNGGL